MCRSRYPAAVLALAAACWLSACDLRPSRSGHETLRADIALVPPPVPRAAGTGTPVSGEGSGLRITRDGAVVRSLSNAQLDAVGSLRVKSGRGIERRAWDVRELVTAAVGADARAVAVVTAAGAMTALGGDEGGERLAMLELNRKQRLKLVWRDPDHRALGEPVVAGVVEIQLASGKAH